MATNMGFGYGLQADQACFKRKFRWLMRIPDVSADGGVQSLPPLRSARPSVSFREMEVQHLTETVYFPGKPEWKPITLTLFDLKRSKNPVMEWIQMVYDARGEGWYGVSGSDNQFRGNTFKKQILLEMYNGAGETMETWVFENAWPQNVDFGDLDMGSSEIVTAEITLRYDRAYVLPDGS